jgi:hypothetical protein
MIMRVVVLNFLCFHDISIRCWICFDSAECFVETLRKLICKAQRDKKEDPSSRGGNSTKKILISANLSDEQWKSVVLGGTKVYPISECEIQGEDTFHILYHLVTMKRPLDKIYLYQ